MRIVVKVGIGIRKSGEVKWVVFVFGPLNCMLSQMWNYFPMAHRRDIDLGDLQSLSSFKVISVKCGVFDKQILISSIMIVYVSIYNSITKLSKPLFQILNTF